MLFYNVQHPLKRPQHYRPLGVVSPSKLKISCGVFGRLVSLHYLRYLCRVIKIGFWNPRCIISQILFHKIRKSLSIWSYTPLAQQLLNFVGTVLFLQLQIFHRQILAAYPCGYPEGPQKGLVEGKMYLPGLR